MRQYQTYSGLLSSAIIAVIILVVISTPLPAYCEVNGTSLLLQQNPIQGGRLNFEPGVHKFSRGSEMVLKATAKPGYSFVYWLGDVRDPMSSTTSVVLNVPKIVIAVFEKNDQPGLFELEDTRSALNDTSGGGGHQMLAAADYANTVYTGGGSAEYDGADYNFNNTDDNDINDDFPTPYDGDDFPVPGEPVPEPGTVFLMLLGGFCLRARRHGR
jgi:hypothetical protein